MNGLITSRVIVVDNDLEDGAAILRSFSKRGIAASFYNGEIDQLPANGFKGVRLLVLDMNLTGSIIEPKIFLGKTVSVVKRLIAQDSALFVILAWTTYGDDVVNELKTMLEEVRPDLKPYFLINMSKTDYKADEDYKIDKILAKIDLEAKNWFPFDLYLQWEQKVFDAATETISMLNKIAKADSAEKTLSQHSNILATLALASGGNTIDNDAFAVSSLFASMNPIFEDRLEHISDVNPLIATGAKKLFDCVNAEREQLESAGKAKSALAKTKKQNTQKQKIANLSKSLNLRTLNNYLQESSSTEIEDSEISQGIVDAVKKYSATLGKNEKLPASVEPSLISARSRGLLNSMIHLSMSDEGECRGVPGNIYLLSKQNKNIKLNLKNCGLDQDVLINKTCDSVPANKNVVVPVLIVITPYCDYAQNKAYFLRLLGGMFVKEEKKSIIKGSGTLYVKKIGPLYIEGKEKQITSGNYYLALNSHFIVGMKKSDLEYTKVICRLRKQALVDIQAWFASHAARPGYISINP